MTQFFNKLTKSDFNHLFNFLRPSGKSVFISGPISTVGRSTGCFSRLLGLHTWLLVELNLWVLLTILPCSGKGLSLFNTQTTQELGRLLPTCGIWCCVIHMIYCLRLTHAHRKPPLLLWFHLKILTWVLAHPTIFPSSFTSSSSY